MDRLDGIKIFVRVVESGSFSAVARELGTGQPAISKQIAALEERLGAQLLMRTSRSLSLTEAGRDFYESAVPLIRQPNPASAQARPRRLAWCASPPRPASLASMSCRNYRRSARAIPRSSSRCWSPSGRAISSKKASTSPFVMAPFRTLALSRERSASPPSLPSLPRSIWNAKESPRASAISTATTA